MRRETRRRRRASPRAAAVPLSLILLVAAPRAARAEDSLAYKYIDYSESSGRIGVQTQVLAANQDLGPDWHIGVTLTDDAISGASPTGEHAPAGSDQVPLASLDDHRKAWEADLSRQFGNFKAEVGTSQSREHDYVSRGWSLNTLTDLNGKNTTILAGIAGHDDDVKTFLIPERLYEEKQALNAILGVTQLLDARTSVKLNVTWGRETGYLDDQYKIVDKVEELAPGSFFDLGFHENLPPSRNMGAILASMNRAFPEAHGALEATYRYYADTFGVRANTLEVQWLQKIGTRFILAPDLRFYEQGAANFYYYDLDATDINPTHVPDPNGQNYTSDYRLSSLYTVTCGLKLTWQANDRLSFDVAVDEYAMHGRDGVTPQSAYPRANIVSVGAKLIW